MPLHLSSKKVSSPPRMPRRDSSDSTPGAYTRQKSNVTSNSAFGFSSKKAKNKKQYVSEFKEEKVDGFVVRQLKSILVNKKPTRVQMNRDTNFNQINEYLLSDDNQDSEPDINRRHGEDSSRLNLYIKRQDSDTSLSAVSVTSRKPYGSTLDMPSRTNVSKSPSKYSVHKKPTERIDNHL